MAKVKFTVDPITRIEGHLKIECEVDQGKISKATSHGEMFRGFEMILKGRHPVDAQQITQRICGVCPQGHAQASTLNLDNALGVTPPTNGRLMRNLMLGANFIQSHLLHFYHLAALDYVDITGILEYKGKVKRLQNIRDWAKAEVASGRASAVAPFLPRYEGVYLSSKDKAANLGAIAHYVQALDMRRKAHEMLTIFGGKMPHQMAIVPGGVTEKPTAAKIKAYQKLIRELQAFIDNVYIPDVLAVAGAYKEYFGIGVGCKNMLAYGCLEKENAGKKKCLPAGVYINGKLGKFSSAKIAEYVKRSKFSSASGLHPSTGETVPKAGKKGAYSWLKAPRYDGNVMEVGPLARMIVNYVDGSNKQAKQLVANTLKTLGADVPALFSVLGRHAARALECKVVADKCAEMVTQLKPGKPVHTKYKIPASSTGMGLTEAPRGALGHWISIKGGKIDRYQCVVPTTWNAGPADDKGQQGPIEQALLGTPIADPKNPIEAVRVVRSFDPCIACAVHMVEPDGHSLGEFRVV